MKVSLLDRLDSLYRAALGAVGLEERAIKEQDALADLRGHSGFSALEDVFEAEMRVCWRKWLETDDEKELVLLHHRAKTIRDMVRLMDRSTTAKMRAEEAELEAQRQADLAKLDAMRQQQALARRPRFPHHANVNS